MNLRFISSLATEYKRYTGVAYNLTSQTGTSGTITEAEMSAEATVTSPTMGTFDCT
jgi:hypothetical protein